VLDAARELVNQSSRNMEMTVRTGVELPKTMTDSPSSQLDQQRQRHNKWLVLIAAYKFLLALFFAAIGVGALNLLHKDIDDVLAQAATILRFNPESRFVNFLLDKASLLDAPMLKRIGALAFSYAGVSLIEGIGLYLEKAWAEYLTLAITASFLPWEIFEVIHRVTWTRVGLLTANAAIFLYLLKLVAGHRKQPEVLETE
jgi:uncharacterized membrane protein (DUF2068 family)